MDNTDPKSSGPSEKDNSKRSWDELLDDDPDNRSQQESGEELPPQEGREKKLGRERKPRGTYLDMHQGGQNKNEKLKKNKENPANDLERKLETIQEKLDEANKELMTTKRNLQIQETKTQEQQEKINENSIVIKTQTETIEKLKTENEDLNEMNEKVRELNKELIHRIANDESNTIKIEDSKKPKILLIADSNGKRLEPQLKQSNSFTIPRYVPANNLRKGAEYLRSEEGRRDLAAADGALMLLGTNDMGNGADARLTYQLTEEIADITTKAKRRLFILEIPPTKTNTKRNIEVRVHNVRLENLKNKSPYTLIVQYFNKIDCMLDREIFQDDLHINPQGKAMEAIVKEIERTITETDFGKLEETIPTPIPTPRRRSLDNRMKMKIPPTTTAIAKEWTIRIPELATGFLIGKKQANKTRLEKKFTVRIQIVSAHDKGDTLFVVSGPKSNVEEAIAEINSSIEKALNKDPPQHQPQPQRTRDPRQNNRATTNTRNRSRSPLAGYSATWQDGGYNTNVWAEVLEEETTVRGTRLTQ